MKLVRKGCAGCGPHVTRLDDAAWRVKVAVGKFGGAQTTANRRKVLQAQENYRAVKAAHDQHMSEHEEETQPCKSAT